MESTAIYIRPGITDMRKQISGLTAVVQNELEKDPFTSALFLFCNRQRRILKAIWWDDNGFCLWQKQLIKDRFPWPADEEGVLEIGTDKLKMLLSGIDFWKAHTKLNYTKV
ncbi:MAG: IS66 family insertion sequence element accessory protein TnpB [Spirochaetaceae bacterium]|nr:IS66 family insertion sequence element accessory protein TnpB [Spirochaetaceae bacterium]